ACIQIRQGSRLTNQTKNIEPSISHGLDGCLKGLVSNGCKAPMDVLMREAERFLLIKLFCVLQTRYRILYKQHQEMSVPLGTRHWTGYRLAKSCGGIVLDVINTSNGQTGWEKSTNTAGNQ